MIRRKEMITMMKVMIRDNMAPIAKEILEATGTAILMSGGPGAAYGSMVVMKILDELKI